MDIIKIENLSVKYNDYYALKDININIKKGAFLNIIGPNGSGKTTLIEVLTNLIKLTTGSYEIISDNIGYLPQKLIGKTNFPITVYEVVKGGLINNKNKDEVDSLVNYWLFKMGLLEFKDENMSVLSGGQQQRVYIVRALINEPDLLILDEPTNSLDPEFRVEFYNLLLDLQSKSNITIINVTHDIQNINFNNNYVLHIDQKVNFFGQYSDYKKKVD